MRGERDVARRNVVLAALRAGKTARAACKEAGVARSTLYAWVARGGDEELAEVLERTSRGRYRKVDGPRAGKAPPDPATPLEPIPAAAAPPPPAVAPGAPARFTFAPGTMPEEEFVQRLRALGLGTLAKLAGPLDQGGAKTEGARVAAARELVQHAERWEAVRRAPLEDREPPAERTASPLPAEEELTAEDAAKRFRVVS